MAMAPPLPLPLPEDLVEQVLLRFPPDDPASLVRAALVCKSWRRLLCGTAFRRRLGEFRRGAAPLLGVLCTTTGTRDVVRDDDDDDDDDTDRRPMKRARILPLPEPRASSTSFVPATSYRLALANGGHRNDDWLAMDAHHGRVLLCRRSNPLALSVWDPFTDEQRDLPEVPLDDTLGYSAAVACAAAAGCDHLDCCHRRGAFLIVAIEVQPYAITFSVYSSESGAWSNPTDLHHQAGSLGTMKRTPGVLVGSALYFLVHFSNQIVEFDLATQQVATIGLPSEFRLMSGSEEQRTSSIVLMTGDDGELGFAASTRYQLKLWSLVPGDGEDDGDFVPTRVIDLHEVIPSDCCSRSPHVNGFADCGDSRRFLFIRTSDGLYSIELNSSHVRKLASRCGDDEDEDVVPYISFCTPTSKYNDTGDGAIMVQAPVSCSAGAPPPDARPTATTVADSEDGGLCKIVPRRRPRTQNPRFYGPEWANN